MSAESSSDKTSPYYEARSNSLISKISLSVRTNVYETFNQLFGDAKSILDLGVTSEQQSREANFLEKLYPHKERITAAGIEDASFLAQAYPGIKFKKIEPNVALPFRDNEFDVTFSHAVVEHVVQEKDRIFFLKEMIRVSKNVFITTPNKFFPVEPHTFIPLIHFLFPKLFYFLINRKIANKFYSDQNLRLLGMKDVKELLQQLPEMKWEVRKVKLGGFTSNLIMVGTKQKS